MLILHSTHAFRFYSSSLLIRYNLQRIFGIVEYFWPLLWSPKIITIITRKIKRIHLSPIIIRDGTVAPDSGHYHIYLRSSRLELLIILSGVNCFCGTFLCGRRLFLSLSLAWSKQNRRIIFRNVGEHHTHSDTHTLRRFCLKNINDGAQHLKYKSINQNQKIYATRQQRGGPKTTC